MVLHINTTPSIASEEEASQFSLFLSERDIQLGGDIESPHERLNNAIIDDIPSSLRDAFNMLGEARSQLLVDEFGKPILEVEDVDMYTFTGPYYMFGKAYITTSTDVIEFRQSFTYEPLLAYIIRFEYRPVGVLYVSYTDGKYEFGYASGNIDAENMTEELKLLSIYSDQPEEDVIFLSIGPVRYAFSINDTIKSTLPWTPEPVSFNDFVKAYYASEMEMQALIAANNGINDFAGGSNAADYFYNADEFINKYELLEQQREVNNEIFEQQREDDSLVSTVITICIVLTFILVGILIYLKHRKKYR